MQPGFGRPGRFQARARPGAWSRLALGFRFDEAAGLAAGRLRTDTLIGGGYLQNVRADEDGRARGTGLLLGLGSAFEYDARRLGDSRWDRVTTMDVVGPRIEVLALAFGLRLRWEAAAAVGFAMVTALPFGSPQSFAAGDLVKSPLREHGYYFARSLTARSQLRLGGRLWDVAAGAQTGAYRSLQGWDRFQERLTADYGLFDRRSRVWLDGGVNPGLDWLRLALQVESHLRVGELLVSRERRTDRAAAIVLELMF
jgi:hypothetical protein